jgi:hypothetical protein
MVDMMAVLGPGPAFDVVTPFLRLGFVSRSLFSLYLLKSAWIGDPL